MTNQPKIPAPETRKRLIKQLRKCNRQLELWDLELQELQATLEADLRDSRRARLQKTNKSINSADCGEKT